MTATRRKVLVGGAPPPAASLHDRSDLLGRMSGCADGRALVVQDGRLVGIVSSRDVSYAIQAAAVRDPSLELGVSPRDLTR